MSYPVLNALPRKETTKGELNSLRKGGKIPAVMYGNGKPAELILLDATEFTKMNAGITESTILSISVEGKKTDAFVKEKQRDAASGKLIHVDFLSVTGDKLLRAKVSVHLVGTPIGVREGGILENPAHEVEVECYPADLPAKIEVDVSALQANHSIHVRDINVDSKVKVLTSPDLVLALVKFAKVETEEKSAAAEGAAATAAAPGAPAAAAPAAAGDKKDEKKEDKK